MSLVYSAPVTAATMTLIRFRNDEQEKTISTIIYNKPIDVFIHFNLSVYIVTGKAPGTRVYLIKKMMFWVVYRYSLQPTVGVDRSTMTRL